MRDACATPSFALLARSGRWPRLQSVVRLRSPRRRHHSVTGRLTNHFSLGDHGVGRERGVGRGLGVALGVAVGVAVGVTLGVAVGVAVGVGVGVGVGVIGGVGVGVAPPWG